MTYQEKTVINNECILNRLAFYDCMNLNIQSDEVHIHDTKYNSVCTTSYFKEAMTFIKKHSNKGK